MSNQPLQHTKQKAPGFFRLLALFLLALAMVEMPFGIGSAFASQERTPNQSREIRQAGHPAVTAIETAIDGPVQATAERRFGELDEPVVAAACSGVAPSDRSAARGSQTQPDLVAALACICSARDPPLTI